MFLLVPLSLAAYQVELVTPVSECVEGESIFVEIHVFPARPVHTTVDIESVPQGFSLVSSRKERRRRDDPSFFNSGRVDSVVFFQEWRAQEPGRRILGPFIINVDGVEQVLAPVEVQVNARNDGGQGELRWKVDGVLHEVFQGTAVPLVLEGRYLTELLSIQCPPPRNALLEQVEAGYAADGGAGAEWEPVASFSWTPLSPGTQALPFARVLYRTDNGEEVTAGTAHRTISVRPAEQAGSDDAFSPLLSGAFSVSPQEENSGNNAQQEASLPESLDSSTDPVIDPARRAWQDGRYGEAIAALRRIEYTVLFPGKYRRIRQDAEHALGFAEYPPPPSKIFVRIVLGMSCVLLFVIVLLLPLKKKSRHLSLCFIFAVLLLMGTLVTGFFVLPPAFHPQAASIGGSLRQIPEDNAGIISAIPAGTPVSVLKKTGTWYYVRLPASGSGWVPEDQIIPYTSAGLYGFW